MEKKDISPEQIEFLDNQAPKLQNGTIKLIEDGGFVLVPTPTDYEQTEISYFHQRGRVIAWFCALQTLGTAGLIVARPYIVSSFGWRWWYGVFRCVCGGVAVFGIVFVKETKYVRPPFELAAPEYRLLALIILFIAMLVSTVIYGKTAQSPTDWGWVGIAVTSNFLYFGFVGVSVSSVVYSMDAYPQRVEAILVFICSLRRFIGFGLSFSTISFIEKAGSEGAMNICAETMAALAILGVHVYFFGKRIRT